MTKRLSSVRIAQTVISYHLGMMRFADTLLAMTKTDVMWLVSMPSCRITTVLSCVLTLMIRVANMDIRMMCRHLLAFVVIGTYLTLLNARVRVMVLMFGYSLMMLFLPTRHEDLAMRF